MINELYKDRKLFTTALLFLAVGIFMTGIFLAVCFGGIAWADYLCEDCTSEYKEFKRRERIVRLKYRKLRRRRLRLRKRKRKLAKTNGKISMIKSRLSYFGQVAKQLIWIKNNPVKALGKIFKLGAPWPNVRKIRAKQGATEKKLKKLKKYRKSLKIIIKIFKKDVRQAKKELKKAKKKAKIAKRDYKNCKN